MVLPIVLCDPISCNNQMRPRFILRFILVPVSFSQPPTFPRPGPLPPPGPGRPPVELYPIRPGPTPDPVPPQPGPRPPSPWNSEAIMATLQWDRIFETCRVNYTNAMLVSGFPPLLRSSGGFQPLAVQPLTSDDIRKMVAVVLPRKDAARLNDVDLLDVQYTADSLFRLLVICATDVLVVLITRPSSSGSSTPTSADWEKQRPIEPAVSLDDNLSTCSRNPGRDAVLAEGCPPITWTQSAFEILAAQPLTAQDLKHMLSQRIPPVEFTNRDHGFLNFGVMFDRTRFNVAVFGHPSPRVMAMINIGAEQRG
jgi:hypothetical protein